MKKIIIGVIALASGLGLVYFLLGQREPVEEQEVAVEVSRINGSEWAFENGGTLSFSEGNYSATVGCNVINGSYSDEEGFIQFGPGAMTRMACPEELQQAEETLVENLALVDSYETEENMLILRGYGVVMVLFAGEPEALTETLWRVHSLREGEAESSSILDEESYLILNKDGGISGKAACNNIIGKYTLDSKGIHFSEIGLTRKVCEPEVMAREKLFTDSLQNAVNYGIHDGVLELSDAGGIYHMTLTPVSE